jgi:hypothetical protein
MAASLGGSHRSCCLNTRAIQGMESVVFDRGAALRAGKEVVKVRDSVYALPKMSHRGAALVGTTTVPALVIGSMH